MLVANLAMRALAIAFLVVSIAALAGAFVAARRERYGAAFLASSLFLASNLGGLAAASFPTLLRSVDDTRTVTAYAAAASPHALRVGAAWFPLGALAVVVLFVRQHRVTRR